MKWGCRGHWGHWGCWGCWGYWGHLGSRCQENHLICNCPKCLPKLKTLGYWWKKALFGISSPWSKLISLTFFITCLSFPVGLTEAIILVAGFNASSLKAWIWSAELPGFGDSSTFYLDFVRFIFPMIPLTFHQPWLNSVKTIT